MGIMGFNSICYREYGWRWRIYASSKFSTSIRANGFYTRMEYYRPWRIYDCTCIWKFSDSETELKAECTKLCSSDVSFKKLVKLQDIVWHGDIGSLTATASVIISFAGYLSTFFPVLQSKQILFQ